jgi:23S rRNA pseudouridine1911/1915/1917 synthase
MLIPGAWDGDGVGQKAGAAMQNTGLPAVTVAYEDDALLVVVKPSGIVVHPAYHQTSGTFWHMLVLLFQDRGLAEAPRLLQRLDRDTSGLLCVSKRLDAHRRLERALHGGRFLKQYLALARGTLEGGATIDRPLGRDPLDRRRVIVRADGQPARTRLRVLRRFPGWTLLCLQLETGRTHQIRAHLASMGHPVAGDMLYGHPQGDAAPRLFLHAHRLCFPHPDGLGMIRCHSPLPDILQETLVDLHRRSRRGEDPLPPPLRMIE